MSTGIIDGNVRALYLLSVTLDPASVANVTCAEQDFTVAGVRAGDICVNFALATATAGLGVAGCRVKADNTVSVTFVNPTAAPIDAASVVCKIVIARPDADLLGGI